MASLVEIFPSDIISESMHKINYNFNLLENRDDVSEQKIQWLKDQIDQRLDEITRTMNENDLNLGKGIDDLSGLFDSMSSSVDIQNAINEALENANIDLTHFIEQTIGQKVREAMAGYSVDSMLTRDQLTGILEEYARSDAFLSFKSQAERQFAEARLLAANSTFFMMNGHLVYNDSRGESSYTSLEDWYSKDSSVRAIVNPDNDPNWKDDPNKVELLKQEGERTFKTLATEMATLDLTVQPGQAAANIIATVKSALGAGNTHSNDAEDITAAIFVKADSMSGSEIILSADKINFRGHAFKLSVDGIRIESTNFNVDEYGHVEAKDIVLKESVTAKDMYAEDMEVHGLVAYDIQAHNIDATNITLSSLGGKTLIDENGILHANGAEITGDVTAKIFNAEVINKDLVDSNDNVIGKYSMKSFMDAENFRIDSNTTLNNSDESQLSSIYITIMPTLPVDNDTDADLRQSATDGNLIGVPVLCFKYRGRPYYLTPNAWKSNSSSSEDMTNMYFTDATRVYTNIDFIGSDSRYNLSVTHSSRNYYIYNPTARVLGNRYNVILTDGYLYKFGYSLDGVPEADKQTYINYLNSYNLTTNPPRYAKNVEQDYILDSVSFIHIRTSSNIGQEFENRLLTGDIYKPFNEYEQRTVSTGTTGPGDVCTSMGMNSSVISLLASLFQSSAGWEWYSNKFTGGTGLGSFLSNNNPFTHFDSSKMFVRLVKDVDGATTETYSIGELTSTPANNRMAYAEFKYIIEVHYNPGSENGWTTVNARSNQGYDLEFDPYVMLAEVSLGTYTTSNATPNDIINFLKNYNFSTNSDAQMFLHINALFIGTSTQTHATSDMLFYYSSDTTIPDGSNIRTI